jgi:hypothetical protein
MYIYTPKNNFCALHCWWNTRCVGRCFSQNQTLAVTVVVHCICHRIITWFLCTKDVSLKKYNREISSGVYTGCPRRSGQNFGRVFLRLNYTDITQNTYIQSWTVSEIMAWENCGILAVPLTVCSAFLRNPHCGTCLEWRVALWAGRMWSGQRSLRLSTCRLATRIRASRMEVWRTSCHLMQ